MVRLLFSSPSLGARKQPTFRDGSSPNHRLYCALNVWIRGSNIPKSQEPQLLAFTSYLSFDRDTTKQEVYVQTQWSFPGCQREEESSHDSFPNKLAPFKASSSLCSTGTVCSAVPGPCNWIPAQGDPLQTGRLWFLVLNLDPLWKPWNMGLENEKWRRERTENQTSMSTYRNPDNSETCEQQGKQKI